MEGLALTGACACAAAVPILLAFALPGLASGRKLSGVRDRMPRRIAAGVSAMLELVGHWAPFVRLCNISMVRVLSERLEPVFSERGMVLSRYACVASLLAACATASLTCVFLSHSLLGVPVGVVACGFGASALVGARERSRRLAAAEQMPEVLRSLSAALSAGKSLPQAITHIGTNLAEPMGSEFLRASFEIEGGRPVEEAVRSLCSRVQAPGIELLGTALQVSQRTGSSLSDLFVRTSRMVMTSVTLRRQLAVKTSQARLSARVVTVVPLLLVGILTIVSPDYRSGVVTPAGGACLCIAALLDLGALVAVRMLMRRSLQ